MIAFTRPTQEETIRCLAKRLVEECAVAFADERRAIDHLLGFSDTEDDDV